MYFSDGWPSTGAQLKENKSTAHGHITKHNQKSNSPRTHTLGDGPGGASRAITRGTANKKDIKARHLGTHHSTTDKARVERLTPSKTAQEVHQEPSIGAQPNDKDTKAQHLATQHDNHNRARVSGRTPSGTAQEVHQEPSTEEHPKPKGFKSTALGHTT